MWCEVDASLDTYEDEEYFERLADTFGGFLQVYADFCKQKQVSLAYLCCSASCTVTVSTNWLLYAVGVLKSCLDSNYRFILVEAKVAILQPLLQNCRLVL